MAPPPVSPQTVEAVEDVVEAGLRAVGVTAGQAARNRGMAVAADAVGESIERGVGGMAARYQAAQRPGAMFNGGTMAAGAMAGRGNGLGLGVAQGAMQVRGRITKANEVLGFASITSMVIAGLGHRIAGERQEGIRAAIDGGLRRIGRVIGLPERALMTPFGEHAGNLASAVHDIGYRVGLADLPESAASMVAGSKLFVDAADGINYINPADLLSDHKFRAAAEKMIAPAAKKDAINHIVVFMDNMGGRLHRFADALRGKADAYDRKFAVASHEVAARARDTAATYTELGAPIHTVSFSFKDPLKMGEQGLQRLVAKGADKAGDTIRHLPSMNGVELLNTGMKVTAIVGESARSYHMVQTGFEAIQDCAEEIIGKRPGKAAMLFDGRLPGTLRREALTLIIKETVPTIASMVFMLRPGPKPQQVQPDQPPRMSLMAGFKDMAIVIGLTEGIRVATNFLPKGPSETYQKLNQMLEAAVPIFAPKHLDVVLKDMVARGAGAEEVRGLVEQHVAGRHVETMMQALAPVLESNAPLSARKDYIETLVASQPSYEAVVKAVLALDGAFNGKKLNGLTSENRSLLAQHYAHQLIEEGVPLGEVMRRMTGRQEVSVMTDDLEAAAATVSLLNERGAESTARSREVLTNMYRAKTAAELTANHETTRVAAAEAAEAVGGAPVVNARAEQSAAYTARQEADRQMAGV